MVEAAARLHIVWDVWIEGLTLRSDPIDDGALHALGIISSCTIGTFLDLLRLE